MDNNAVLRREVVLPKSSPGAALFSRHLLQAGVPGHIVARGDLDVSLQELSPLRLPLPLQGQGGGEEGGLELVGKVAVDQAALVSTLLTSSSSCCLVSCLSPLQHPCLPPPANLVPLCHPRFLCHTSAHGTSLPRDHFPPT